MLRAVASASVLALDFDGVILDTESTAGLAWHALFARHGARLDDATRRAVAGRHDARDVLLDALLGQCGDVDREAAHRWWLDRQIELAGGLELPAHVRRTLDRAGREQIRLVVASAATLDWVVPHLRRLGILELFDHVVCGDGRPPKPDPAVYLEVLRVTGAHADEVLAVEDSPSGVRAARAAGLTCVGLGNDVHPAAALGEAHAVVASLDELWAPGGPRETTAGTVACAC